MIPYGRQDITQADIDTVIEVLKSDFLTQGPKVPLFEEAVASYCGARHGVAVTNATSALHMACLALDVGKGDIVWTTAITFVASANCALYCGASVDFLDIDPRTYNIDVEKLEAKLHKSEKRGSLPKVLIAVHLCGQSCDMVKIKQLGDRFGFEIIEDASHAIGGRYYDENIGSCQYSAVTVFSFHPVKIITTAEGGIALTNDLEVAHKLRLIRSHGITTAFEGSREKSASEIWNYQQVDLGFNFRMTDLQAALGLSQLARLDEYVDRRQRLAKRYDSLLLDAPVITPMQTEACYSAFHLYVIRLDSVRARKSQIQVYNALREKGVGVNLHYIPVYLQPFYAAKGFKRGYCQEAERYFSEAITLPLYPAMTDTDQDFVVDQLLELIVQ